MFRILDNRGAIENAHQRFATALQALSTETVSIPISHQGGTHNNARTMWLSSLGIWAHLGLPLLNQSRYWDVFGIGEPIPPVTIICQINSPRDGINRNIAGAFGVNDEGELAVFHRGLLHGAGLNRKFFQLHYHGKRVWVMDEDRRASLALVAVVDSADFRIDLKNFVLEIARIKNLAYNDVRYY